MVRESEKINDYMKAGDEKLSKVAWVPPSLPDAMYEWCGIQGLPYYANDAERESDSVLRRIKTELVMVLSCIDPRPALPTAVLFQSTERDHDNRVTGNPDISPTYHADHRVISESLPGSQQTQDTE